MFEEFIVSLSANLATKFLTSAGKKDTDGIKASLDSAFAEGVKYFLNSHYNNKN